MIDPVTSRIWLHRLLFVALAAGLMFLKVLPLDTTPGRIPGPDLLLALAYAWVQRRPEFVPPLLLAAVFLLADMLMMRPPGLWTLLVLLGAEFLRTRHQGSGEMPFASEMLFTASAIAVVTLSYLVVLGVAGVVHGGVGMHLVRMVMTILFYPAVVLLSRLAFDLRRSGPTDEIQRPAR